MYLKLEKYYAIILTLLSMIIVSGCTENSPSDRAWEPVDGVMLSRWAKEIDPENVLPEYPRPQMVREEWMNLNGLWDFALVSKDVDWVDTFNEQILVPFPVESALSGLKKVVTEEDRLWYRRYFDVPNNWKDRRLLLHFDAVDWEATVYVNGQEIGRHRGGYDQFTFDISDALKDKDKQELVVSVWDPTDDGHQPKGKQTTDTHGFWYTAVTGIWQSVWMEPVEKNYGYIKSFRLIPDIDNKTVTLEADLSKIITDKHRLKFTAIDAGKIVGEFTGNGMESIILSILEQKLWSPENPHLYEAEIELVYDNTVVDKIDSYFAMRKIGTQKDDQGILRLALNNQIYFQFGMLDQGWWPGGLYRAPTDNALRYDIEVTKQLGFNMLRKHGKVEPQRWYTWCDKLGVLVWQDMTPGDIQGEYGTNRTEQSKTNFENEYAEMITELYNHPSVIIWVIFNEGWGQYDTERLVKWTKELDQRRLVVGASGFVDKGVGDLHDVHGYPGPTGAAIEKMRATTLGEFGGLGFPVKGHLWDETKAWGYVNYKDIKALEDAYGALIDKLHPYVSEGISAAIYTQITDVENEVNGMMTYDREMIKMDQNYLRSIADKLYSVQPGSFHIESVLPTSQESGQEWRYVFSEPDGDWQDLNFDASAWKVGAGGFGDPKDSNPVIRTVWKGREMWLRRKFDYQGKMDDPLYIQAFHQFENETVLYLNGKEVAQSPEHSNAYTFIQLDNKAKLFLNSGENILAVYAKNNGRRAYFDAGLVYITKGNN